jgi:type IX secretion system PorP/SprF family membrane protein
MKKVQLFLLAILISAAVQAQQIPMYSLYVMDPFLINPAAAGLHGASHLHLNHRQQWRGIQGAPVTSTLLLHLPVTHKASLGVVLMNDARGPLATNSGEFTFAYRVPLGEEHNIRFGLSGGVGWNSVNFDKLNNTDDQVLLEQLDNNFFVTGRFGMFYNFRNLNLGFVFPSLFKSDLLSDAQFEEIVPDPLRNYYLMANYRFDIGPNLAFEPWGVYKAGEDGTSQWEASGIVRIMDVFWLGGTYRQGNEYAAMAGFQISDIINLGYAYEPAGNKVDGYSNGSHELHLSIRLGKKKRKKETPVNSVAQKQKMEEEPVEEVQAQEETTVWQKPAEQQPADNAFAAQEVIQQDSEDDQPITVKRGSHPLEMSVGHYVIVGAFSVFGNAEKYSDNLFKRGYPASFGYLTEKNLYYVWLYTGANATNTRSYRNHVRKNKLFRDAWYLLVEN